MNRRPILPDFPNVVNSSQEEVNKLAEQSNKIIQVVRESRTRELAAATGRVHSRMRQTDAYIVETEKGFKAVVLKPKSGWPTSPKRAPNLSPRR